MGQLLLADNIPNAVKASTTSITIAASNNGQPTRLTVGGQQYAPASTLTLSTGSVGANGLDAGSLGSAQLWYVYAVVNQTTFAVAVVASQTGPSSGPTMPSGYGTAYKLVSAFYTDGSSLVGSIVQISGEVETEWMTYSPTWGASTTQSTNIARWKRLGDQLVLRNNAVFSNTGVGGNVIPSLPGSLTIDTAKLTNSASINEYLGQGLFFNGTNYSTITNTCWVECLSTGVLTISFYQNTNSANGGGIAGTDVKSGTTIKLEWRVPVSGWKATLL